MANDHFLRVRYRRYCKLRDPPDGQGVSLAAQVVSRPLQHTLCSWETITRYVREDDEAEWPVGLSQM